MENEKQPTILQLPATLDKYESLTNGSVKFVFSTQENLKPEYLLFIMNGLNKVGNLNFAVRKIEAEDLSKLPEPDKAKYAKSKTPSQRLRSVIWLLHQQKGGKEDNFQEYYDQVMEYFINQIKEKLD